MDSIQLCLDVVRYWSSCKLHSVSAMTQKSVYFYEIFCTHE
jgi:hypothetical protein